MHTTVRMCVNSVATQRLMAVRSTRLGLFYASLCCHIVYEFNRDFRERMNRHKTFLGKILRPCSSQSGALSPQVYTHTAIQLNTGKQTHKFLPVFPGRSAMHVEGPWQPCCPAVQ